MLQFVKFVKSYLDLDGVAKDKGIKSYAVSTAIVQKTAKTEHFAIRTQAQWMDWVDKLEKTEFSLLCKNKIKSRPVTKYCICYSYLNIR